MILTRTIKTVKEDDSMVFDFFFEPLRCSLYFAKVGATWGTITIWYKHIDLNMWLLHLQTQGIKIPEYINDPLKTS